MRAQPSVGLPLHTCLSATLAATLVFESLHIIYIQEKEFRNPHISLFCLLLWCSDYYEVLLEGSEGMLACVPILTGAKDPTAWLVVIRQWWLSKHPL
jgi:hypothetical protein